MAQFVIYMAVFIPAIAMLLFLSRLDHVNEQPFRMLWFFVAGGISTVVSLILSSRVILKGLYSANPILSAMQESLFSAAIPEEIAKCICLICLALPLRYIRNPLDGLLCGAAVALGFAVVENVGYSMQLGASTGLLRAGSAVIGHMMDGSMMGYFLAIGILKKRWEMLLLMLVIPIGLHFLWDFPLMVIRNSGIPSSAPWTLISKENAQPIMLLWPLFNIGMMMAFGGVFLLLLKLTRMETKSTEEDVQGTSEIEQLAKNLVSDGERVVHLIVYEWIFIVLAFQFFAGGPSLSILWVFMLRQIAGSFFWQPKVIRQSQQRGYWDEE